MSEHESLVARQEEMSTLLTRVLESGVSLFSTSLIQVSQALLFYQLLGSNTSPLFNHLVSELIKCPDPSPGFFLFDNTVVAGLYGFRYNYWCMVKTDLKIQTKLAKLISAKSRQVECQVGTAKAEHYPAVTKKGSLTHCEVCHFGNRAIWTRLIENTNMPRNWVEYTDEYPIMLYRKAKSAKELRYKMSMKLHSPDVVKSLSKTNALVSVLSANAYILSRKVMSVSGLYRDLQDPSENLKDKRSLLGLLKQENREFNSGTMPKLSSDQLAVLFPEDQGFEDAQIQIGWIETGEMGRFDMDEKPRKTTSNFCIYDTTENVTA